MTLEIDLYQSISSDVRDQYCMPGSVRCRRSGCDGFLPLAVLPSTQKLVYTANVPPVVGLSSLTSQVSETERGFD